MSDQEVLNLVATLRQMDQLIYRMSQCQSWGEMRPIFNQLCDGTIRRMNAESDRIRTLMIPEIQKVYGQGPTTMDQPKLEGPKDGN